MAHHRVRVSSCFVVLVALFATQGCGPRKPSDEDHIERFISDVTGAVDATYEQRTMAYVDFAAYPLDLQTPMHLGMYGEGQVQDVTADFRRAVGRLQGTELKRRSSRIEIKGDVATVELGLISAFGPFDASIGLRKQAEGVWRVNRVRLRR